MNARQVVEPVCIVEVDHEVIINAPYAKCRLSTDLTHLDTVRLYKDTPDTLCLQIRASRVTQSRGANKGAYASVSLNFAQLDALMAKLDQLRRLV